MGFAVQLAVPIFLLVRSAICDVSVGQNYPLSGFPAYGANPGYYGRMWNNQPPGSSEGGYASSGAAAASGRGGSSAAAGTMVRNFYGGEQPPAATFNGGGGSNRAIAGSQAMEFEKGAPGNGAVAFSKAAASNGGFDRAGAGGQSIAFDKGAAGNRAVAFSKSAASSGSFDRAGAGGQAIPFDKGAAGNRAVAFSSASVKKGAGAKKTTAAVAAANASDTEPRKLGRGRLREMKTGSFQDLFSKKAVMEYFKNAALNSYRRTSDPDSKERVSRMSATYQSSIFLFHPAYTTLYAEIFEKCDGLTFFEVGIQAFLEWMFCILDYIRSTRLFEIVSSLDYKSFMSYMSSYFGCDEACIASKMGSFVAYFS